MTKQEIQKAYLSLALKLKRYPTLDDLRDHCDVTRAMVRTHFNNLSVLKDQVVATGNLSGVILDVESLDTEYVKESLKKLGKYKRFVITSAVANSKVNKTYFENIKLYCKHENALLVVIPSLLKGTGAKYTIDPILKDEVIMFFDYRLNDNIQVLSVANNAKATDPITGLPRLGKRNGSIIIGSPKQNMKIVATGLNKLPHALIGTGAITDPNYISSAIMQSKQDVMADNDHVLGAVIVELDENEMFHFRGTQADKRNAFTDLGSYYSRGKKWKYSPEAIVGGDLHVTETCPVSEAALFDMVKKMSIKKLIAHDIFTGRACNPHETEQRLFLTKRAGKNELSIDVEIKELANFLKSACNKVEEVIVVRSNHDEFLNRYLESGSYVNHPFNHRIALSLALHVLDGKNPLEEACKSLGVSPAVKWLKRDESYQVGYVELGAHGDKGSNGSRGSAKSMEEGYGACVYGHSHTPNIMRSAYCVGTNTEARPYYGSGPSSWLNTDCLVYPNGVRQLINKIEGKYTTRKL